MIKLLIIGVLSSVLRPSWYDEIVKWWYNVWPNSVVVDTGPTQVFVSPGDNYASVVLII